VHEASQTSGATVVTVNVRLIVPRLQVKVPLLVNIPFGRGWPNARLSPAAGVKLRSRLWTTVASARPGTILIDLSSVLPSTPRAIEPRATARGVHFLEAPVSGGVAGARAATLAVMVGGDTQVLERARPVLRAIGPNIFHVGPVGSGNTVKAINNMMACVNALAMMEGVALGVKAGLDPMTIYEVVKASSGGSKALERIVTAIVPRKFEPGFKVRLMNKDLETFTTIAKELHVPVSFANVAQRYEQMAMAAGLADQDTTVVMTIIERLAAIHQDQSAAIKR